eukprot:scaffold9073_cov119-Skeletonema_marinoi.AAC.1
MRFFPAVIAAVSSLSYRSSVPLSYRRHNLAFLQSNRHHIRGGASSTLAAAAILPPHHPATLSSLRAASSDTTAAAADKKKPIPTILLAGFLGSGKTSTLKHLLENNQNIRIGTIVNDVASVNIDAKLISNSDSNNDNRIDSMADGVVELQNGCACCSLADELLTSVERLTEGGKRELDAIVVELSGVADPVAVRDNWEQAKIQGHPATKLADLKRTVTLVDSSTFGTDWMTFDVAGERESWTEPGDDCSAVRKVPELLAEQVEAANLLLINKIDLAGEKQVKVASGLARGLNENASIMEVEFGKVDVKELLGKALGSADGNSHDHNHHDHSSECSEPACTDDSHSHSHDHTASTTSDCSDPECTDTSHSHPHEHTSDCADPECTDTSHSHSHEHTSDCADPECTDTSHSHSHDHKTQTTSADQLGIGSFVYRASTPFNSQRLMALLNRWPIPIKDSLDFGLVMGLGEDDVDDAVENKAFVGVLRSKGFCWMAPTKWSNSAGNDVWRHDTAMYWSHAGKHFGITSAGKWWGCLTKEQIKPYFANNVKEYDRIMAEDWVSEEWGDRRQELVFIGMKLDEAEIRAALDACLCTADEMEVYRAQVRNILEASFSSVKGGPSLFDVGGMDHIDQ